MLWFKSSLTVLALALVSNAYAIFSDSECLMANLDAKVVHKGKPWGLAENTLKIHKKDCLIIIESERMKVFKEKWVIDVCREPVHIKTGTEGVEVIKREKACVIGDRKPHKFCKTVQELDTLIQDDGLIFADGYRETLATEHGKVFCSYLLSMAYLRDGLVFNRDVQYQDVLIKRDNSAKGAIPAPTPVSTPVTATTTQKN